METFLEFLREALKGIVREVGAYFFRKSVLKHKENLASAKPLGVGDCLVALILYF